MRLIRSGHSLLNCHLQDYIVEEFVLDGYVIVDGINEAVPPGRVLVREEQLQ